ncbi:MAG: DUF423 domain-containing protein [Opitutales bacterium]
MGAFGAHALEVSLASRGMVDVWKTAVSYELIHAVAVLALVAWMAALNGRSDGNAAIQRLQVNTWLSRAAGCWLGGVGLFSGSLYVLAMGGPSWVGVVTPVGGLGLLAGWVCVAIAGWRDQGDNW